MKFDWLVEINEWNDKNDILSFVISRLKIFIKLFNLLEEMSIY